MRKRVLAGVTVLIAVAALLIWFLVPTQPAPTSPGSTDAPTAVAPTTSEAPSTGAKATRNNPSELPGPDGSLPAPGFTSGFEQWVQRRGIDYWSSQVHRPIEFYGKVVDENTRPIEGAVIEFSCNRFLPPEGSTSVTKRSDADGLFSVSGLMGSTLGVYVTKPGYYPVKSQNQAHFDFLNTRGSAPFQPSSGDPIIFHLRKAGTGAELVTSEYGVNPGLDLSMPRDGTVVRVDILNRSISAEGQLELSAIKPSRGQPASDWSFRLSIPSGGLLEESDEFPFEAPEAGYRPTIEYQFKPGGSDWTEYLRKHFYVAFGEPRKYGRIDIETGMDRGVSLKYVFNPSGSRNLEPKPAGVSTPAIPPWLPPGVKAVVPEKGQ